MRYSFASYHYAHNTSLDGLVSCMGHSDSTLIFKHYREVVIPEDAATYWSIKADSASNVIPIENNRMKGGGSKA